MSDLTAIEKRKLERALRMSNGYVLNFSNRTFADFFSCFDIDIYHNKYERESGSKANRMRSFWEQESNYLVAKVLSLLLEEWNEFASKEPPEELLKIVQRLQESALVTDIGTVIPEVDDEDFEILVRSVKECIDRNEPKAGLDRLHTFVVKYFRRVCANRGIETDREKPLHSLVGEYVKKLKQEGLIESDMTERILKSSISIMEAFSRVRNNQSLAHDNQLLNHNESLLIFGHVTSSIRFIEAIELADADHSEVIFHDNDEISF